MMDKIDEKVIIASALSDALDKPIDTVIAALEKCVGPGRISPETAAAFLDVSYRTVYRWLSGSKFFRPSLEQCQLIADFVLRVEGIREACVELLALRLPENKDLRRALLNPRLLRVLDRDVSFEDKVSLLVKQVVRELAPKS